MIATTRDQQQTRVRRIVVGNKMGRNQRQVMRRIEEAKIAGNRTAAAHNYHQISCLSVILTSYSIAAPGFPRNIPVGADSSKIVRVSFHERGR